MYSLKQQMELPKTKHLVSAARYQVAVDEQGEAWARHHLTVAVEEGV